MRSVLRAFTAVAVTVVAVGFGGTALAAPPVITPTPTFTVKPAAFVNTTTATFEFTDTNTSATFTCSLDGAKATACTSPKTYTGLTVGAHTLTVKAQAPGLKPSKTATASWTIDLTAPNTPIVSQPTTPTNSTSASITFSSSSTDIGSYLCSLDGAAATTCTSPKSLTALADGTHSFTVKAVDRAGNVSGTRAVMWVVDTAVATPFISSAPPSTSTGSVEFRFGSTDTDVTFSCSMDSTNNNSYSACSSPKTYTGLSNANHTFRVRATDTAGNVSTVASYTWKVQNAPPITVGWSNPSSLPASVTNQTDGTFAFSASGQSTLTCKLDGVVQASCTSPQSVSGLADGTHTYAVVANSGLPSEVTLPYAWTVDTVAPDAPSIDGPSGRVASADADIVVTPAAVGDSVTCEVDAAPVDCSTVVSLTGLADGDHSISATATDAAGNTASAEQDWTVDTTGPTAVVTAPTSLTGPFVVELDEDASGVDATSVVLADESGASMASSLLCRTAASDVTDCSAGDVRSVEVTASSRLVLGQSYRVQVNPVGVELVTDDLGNVAAAVDDVVRAPTSAGELSLGGAFTWRKMADKKASGGSYFVEHRKGARASWSFSGKAVSWVTLTGPTQGKADVYIDGVRKATVNNYAKTVKHGVLRTVKGLAAGSHTIEIRVLGKKGAKAGKGTFVAIDGFKVGKTVTATPVLARVAWQRAVNASAEGGGFAVADLKAQTFKVTVRGTSVTLHTVRGPSYGKVALYVDGTLIKTADLYAKTVTWNYQVTAPSLTDGVHTVLVKVLGSKNSKSTSTAVAVDALSVT